MIVGVTGFLGSGKDTFADYLVKQKAFEHISLSDMLRDEIRKRKKEITRDLLQTVGNELRSRYGSGVLAVRALQKTVPEKNYVITSIRTRAEVEVLKERKEFVLVFIDAPIETRFERTLARMRENDPLTLESFKKAEEKEMHGNEGSQQLSECRKMASIIVKNDKTIAHLYVKSEKLVDDLKKRFPYIRPNWDEYFLNIMGEIGKRGTCERGRLGCVITKNNRILTTGYAGAPPGLPHCDEIGHLFQKVEHFDGKIRQHCIRTIHGEQNAIAQAAKYGISIDGATLYCSMSPCNDCAKLIVATGISRVVCKKVYHGSTLATEMFSKAGIQLDVLSHEVERYEKM
jgi:dCMP deaminase